MNYLGIDPGLTGALALITPSGELLAVEDMPTLNTGTKSRKEIDGAALVGMLEDWRAYHGEFRAVLEAQRSMPNQSAQSGHKTGKGFGLIIGVLCAMKVPYATVRAQKWQGAVLGKIPKGTSKDHARAKASQTFPEANLGTRKTQDRPDAICIALYGVTG